jgi:hypothetical protein
VTERGLQEIRYRSVGGWDWRLEAHHNTRHATRRHGAAGHMTGRQVSSPWLARFDWVLDRHPETEPGATGPTILTKRRDQPRSVFVRLGRLEVFLDAVLPRLEQPVVVYLGNRDQPLSRFLPNLHRILGDPRVAAVFSEHRDLDLPPVTAMPVGVHPVDLLIDDGARTLERLATQTDPGAKRDRVLVPFGRAAARFGDDAVAPPSLGAALAAGYGGGVTTAEYWEALAGHRFLLAPLGLPYDSAAPMEALTLGTIPILRRGPLAEAYAGLPVVTIDDPSEISRSSLDAWWEAHAGAFADRRFVSPAWWWARIASRMPGRKRAFLVLGPESHGTHLVTDLLVHAGCHGHAGDHSSWHGEWQEGAEDVQPWDRHPPTDEDPIVWRRSVPHLRNWPDIAAMVETLRRRGYEVRAIVVHRDRYAAIRSQLKWRHVPDVATARANIARAYPHVFAHLQAAAVPATCVTYESLVQHPAARDELLTELGLEPPKTPLETWDGNRKWYEEPAEAESPIVGPAPSPVEARFDGFPEHWFRCEPAGRVEYEQCVARGHARMRERSVVFCGLARDVADALPALIHSIEHLGTRFRDYRVVVYENDSTDDTLVRLRAWSHGNSRVDVLSERPGLPRWPHVRDPERMRQLAACRNRYLDHLLERYEADDHVIVLDTDLPRGFSHEGVAHTFGLDGWDAVGSNMLSVPSEGRPPPQRFFFDAWAFRRVGETTPSFAEVNRLHFRRGAPPVRVWSVFGGLAVYTMAAMRSGARYGGDDCEHVVLHGGMRERGFDRIFLNPSQIVLHESDA